MAGPTAPPTATRQRAPGAAARSATPKAAPAVARASAVASVTLRREEDPRATTSPTATAAEPESRRIQVATTPLMRHSARKFWQARVRASASWRALASKGAVVEGIGVSGVSVARKVMAGLGGGLVVGGLTVAPRCP